MDKQKRKQKHWKLLSPTECGYYNCTASILIQNAKTEIEMLSNYATMCVYFLQKYVKLYFKHFRWLTRSVTLLVTLTITGNISYVCLFRLSAANLRISLLWFVSALWKKFCALKRDIYGHSNSYMSHKCPIYSIYLVI